MCRINMANGTRGTMRTMNNQKTVMRILGGKTSRGSLDGDVMTWKDGTTWTRVSAERSRSAPPYALPSKQTKADYTKTKPKLDWDHVLSPEKKRNDAGEINNRVEDKQQDINNHIIKVENQ